MEPCQGEFRPLFLDAVVAGHGVHAQAAFHYQPLTRLHPVLQILCQVAPAHNLQLARGILRPQTLYLHQHLGHRCLVVLGVANLGRLQDVDLKQTVIQPGTPQIWPPS